MYWIRTETNIKFSVWIVSTTERVNIWTAWVSHFTIKILELIIIFQLYSKYSTSHLTEMSMCTRWSQASRRCTECLNLCNGLPFYHLFWSPFKWCRWSLLFPSCLQSLIHLGWVSVIIKNFISGMTDYCLFL